MKNTVDHFSTFYKVFQPIKLVNILSIYPHGGLVFEKKVLFTYTYIVYTVDLQYLEKNTVEPPHPHSSTERLL